LNGGSGNDIFIFRSLAESTSSTPDIIEDFSRGVDKIDVSAIDANTRRANDQAFAFAGRSASAVPNSLSWFESGGNTIVQVDVDGNRAADMEIVLVGTSLGLTAADFVL
jgi:Ca2+-binding RTX toxin-like protein